MMTPWENFGCVATSRIGLLAMGLGQVTIPQQLGAMAFGLMVTAHGQGGTVPGQGALVLGQGAMAHGLADTAHGLADTGRGQGVTAPGQADTIPGQEGMAPGLARMGIQLSRIYFSTGCRILVAGPAIFPGLAIGSTLTVNFDLV